VLSSTLLNTHVVFLTPRDLATRHNTSTGHLANLRSQGRGVPYVQFSSRRVGYRLADVEQWEASRLVQTASAA
jgi:hypothetical protein